MPLHGEPARQPTTAMTERACVPGRTTTSLMYVVSCSPTHGLSTSCQGDVKLLADRRYRPLLVAAYTLPAPSNTSRPTRWFSSSVPPTRWNVAPPSAERRIPVPAYESELVLASPVPTHSDPSAGLSATAPIDSV